MRLNREITSKLVEKNGKQLVEITVHDDVKPGQSWNVTFNPNDDEARKNAHELLLENIHRVSFVGFLDAVSAAREGREILGAE